MSASRTRRGINRLLSEFPDRDIESVDSQLPHPLEVWDVDEGGHRISDRPYRVWELPAGPWMLVTFVGGEEFAIWKQTGDVYRVVDGAVGEAPLLRVEEEVS